MTITLPFLGTNLLVKSMGMQLVAMTQDSSEEERFPFLGYHQKGKRKVIFQRQCIMACLGMKNCNITELGCPPRTKLSAVKG
jgi:hypothetical protein